MPKKRELACLELWIMATMLKQTYTQCAPHVGICATCRGLHKKHNLLRKTK